MSNAWPGATSKCDHGVPLSTHCGACFLDSESPVENSGNQISGPNFPVPNSGSENPVNEIPVKKRALYDKGLTSKLIADITQEASHMGRFDEWDETDPTQASLEPQNALSESLTGERTYMYPPPLPNTSEAILEVLKSVDESLKRIADALDDSEPEPVRWGHYCPRVLNHAGRTEWIVSFHDICSYCGAMNPGR